MPTPPWSRKGRGRRSPVTSPARTAVLPRRRRHAPFLSTPATTGDTFPTLKIEAAFGSGPRSDLTTAAWTDITQWCRHGSTGRGRSNELDEITTGRASLVLDNSDRRFDPLYTAGPYYPNVEPLTPIRVTATFNSTPYVLFTGYATGWPQSYAPPNYSEVQLSAVDGFEVLAQTTLASTLFHFIVTHDQPDAWYPLNETSGTTAVELTASRNGTYLSSPTFSAEPLVARDDTAVTFAGSSYMRVGIDATPPTDAYIAECWFSSDPVAGTGVAVFAGFNRSGSDAAPFDRNLFWFNQASAADPGTMWGVAGSARVDDGEPHHAVFVAGGGGASVYLDGAFLEGLFFVPDTQQPAPARVIVGAATGVTIQHFVLYHNDSALSATKIAEHYNAGLGGDGDKTGQRINRILDGIEWPAAMRDIDLGYTSMPAADIPNDALTALQNCAKAEAGLLYMSRAGKVVFRDRYRRLNDGNSNSPLATFGDAGGSEYPYFHQGFELAYDRDRIRNVATGTRPGGQQIVHEDTTSTDQYGDRPYTAGTVEVITDDELRARLEYTVDKYKDPAVRLDQATLIPQRPPEGSDTWTAAMHWSIVLSLDLSQQFTVKRRPQNVGSAISVAVLVEGVDHTFAPREWKTSVRLSPADTREYARFDLSTFDSAAARFAY